YWPEVNVDCQVMNRFGQQIQEKDCPTSLSEGALRRLLWKPSPLRWSGGQVACTSDFADACIVNGVVTVRTPSAHESPLPPALETCSETGRNRYAFNSKASLDDFWADAERTERATVGFILNLPETGGNVWHNLHWLVPAVARLYGTSSASALKEHRAPEDVVLILLFDGYTFEEDKLDPGSAPSPDRIQREKTQLEQQRQLSTWVVRHAPFLQLLTSSPPLLFHTIRQRCFGRLLWGHAEMRADRELAHQSSVGRQDVLAFNTALVARHGRDMDDLSKR
ncbi:unnamed protein product, partial [Polarella glacialis]